MVPYNRVEVEVITDGYQVRPLLHVLEQQRLGRLRPQVRLRLAGRDERNHGEILQGGYISYLKLLAFFNDLSLIILYVKEVFFQFCSVYKISKTS